MPMTVQDVEREMSRVVSDALGTKPENIARRVMSMKSGVVQWSLCSACQGMGTNELMGGKCPTCKGEGKHGKPLTLRVVIERALAGK